MGEQDKEREVEPEGASEVGAKEVPIVGEIRPWRQVMVETDGNSIRVTKNETAGTIELGAIFRALADQFTLGG